MIELQKKIVLPWGMVDYYKYIDNKQLYACLVGCCLMLDECVTINKRLSIFSLPSSLYRWIVERCMDSLFFSKLYKQRNVDIELHFENEFNFVVQCIFLINVPLFYMGVILLQTLYCRRL